MIRVVGLGNVLMGDDGFGPSVIHALERGWQLPEGVELVDAGTPGLSLSPYLSGAEVVVVVDVVRHGGAPGEVHEFTREQVLRAPAEPRVSPHDIGVQDALRALELAGIGPQSFHVVATAPERVTTGLGLTPRVRAAVEDAASRVVEVVARYGARLTRREQPVDGAAWWEPV